MILALRTDAPAVELSLMAADGTVVAQEKWDADRQLAQELLGRITSLLERYGSDFSSLTGLIGFRGPGSFTGLRIGLTVLNTLAYGLHIPVVGTTGEEWRAMGVRRLIAEEDDTLLLPEYGAEARITPPKK